MDLHESVEQSALVRIESRRIDMGPVALVESEGITLVDRIVLSIPRNQPELGKLMDRDDSRYRRKGQPQGPGRGFVTRGGDAGLALLDLDDFLPTEARQATQFCLCQSSALTRRPQRVSPVDQHS